MTRRVYFYFVLTFVLGVILGALGLFGYAWYGGHWRREYSRARVVARLRNDLKLSDSQVQQLNRILDAAHQKYQSLHHDVDPKFDAVRNETDNEIRQMLDPAQVARFNQMARQWRARARRK